MIFFIRQKTAYEMLMSDWSPDVCSSDLLLFRTGQERGGARTHPNHIGRGDGQRRPVPQCDGGSALWRGRAVGDGQLPRHRRLPHLQPRARGLRSEEHTSELQSLMRISYAVFCLKKKNMNTQRLNAAQLQVHLHVNTTHEGRVNIAKEQK